MRFYAYHVLHITSLLLRPLTLMSRCHLPVFRYCSLKRRESSPGDTFWRMWGMTELQEVWVYLFFLSNWSLASQKHFPRWRKLALELCCFPTIAVKLQKKKKPPLYFTRGFFFLKGICEIFVTALIFGPQQQLSAALVHLPSISLTATISELFKPLQYLLQKAWEASGAT